MSKAPPKKRQGYFEQMWKGIVRPPRLIYS